MTNGCFPLANGNRSNECQSGDARQDTERPNPVGNDDPDYEPRLHNAPPLWLPRFVNRHR